MSEACAHVCPHRQKKKDNSTNASPDYIRRGVLLETLKKKVRGGGLLNVLRELNKDFFVFYEFCKHFDIFIAHSDTPSAHAVPD